MNDWLALGLGSTGLHASISVADKVILERYLNSNWAYPFFTALFLGLYCLGILVVRLALDLFHPPSLLAVGLALLPGLLHYAAALVSVQALRQADASTVAGIAQIGPIFSVLWGALFFNEQFAALNYAGIGLLVTGAGLLAWERPVDVLTRNGGQRSHGHFSQALRLILVSALLRSLSDLFTKVAVTDLAFWDAFALSRLGMLVPALLLFLNPVVREAVVRPARGSGLRVIGIVAVIEVLALVNLLLITAAYDRGPLALVSASQSTVPLFILVLTGLVNHRRPGLVPVKGNGQSGWMNLILCAAIVLGVFLMSYRTGA